MSATGALSGIAINVGVEFCNRFIVCDVSARFFHVCPVRSSMNSRQLAGRAAGSALIARRIARLTRSPSFGQTCFGGGKSFLIFFIQQSSGLVFVNGTSPVTIMYSVAPRL